MWVCQFTGSYDCALALSSKHLRAQQIKNFIEGYKVEDPIGAEEDKFMSGIISSLDGKILLDLS